MMKIESSLISIVVPCYNQAEFMHECLQSVLDQTYQNWECIIVNDGSLDSTEEVARKWVSKDNRFKYLLKQNGGLSSARNAGIERAEGEWILPLDCDDVISKDYLELASKQFQNKDVKLIYANAIKFGTEQGKWILPEFSLKELAQGNCIYCTAFFRKLEWERVGGYDQKMIFGFEDWEFWISILKDGGNVYKIEANCFFYRVKLNSMIKELHTNRRNKMQNYLAIKHTEFFIQYLGNFHQLARYKKEYMKKYDSKMYKILDYFISFFKK